MSLVFCDPQDLMGALSQATRGTVLNQSLKGGLGKGSRSGKESLGKGSAQA